MALPALSETARRGRPPLGLPVLALVDAFVGGVAIVLVILLLSANNRTPPTHVPQADIVLTCGAAPDRIGLPGAPAPVPIGDLPGQLAAAAPATALSLRVQIRASAADPRCALLAKRRLDGANTALSASTAPAPHPVFLIDISYAAAPGASPAATGPRP